MRKIAFLALAVLALQGCGEVNNGHRGFTLSYGKVSSPPLTEGLYFYWPMWPTGTELVQVKIKENNLKLKTEFFTGDNQAIDTELELVWSVEPSKVSDLYTNVGDLEAIETVKVKNNFLGAFKDVVGKQSIDNIVQNRDKVALQALSELREKLAPMGILVHTLNISDMQPAKAYRDAVEAKMVAKQGAEKAKMESVTVEEVAKQTIKAATADAEAMKIKTAALAQSKSLVEYEMVQMLKTTWNGALPTTVISSGGGGPLQMFNLDKVINKQ